MPETTSEEQFKKDLSLANFESGVIQIIGTAEPMSRHVENDQMEGYVLFHLPQELAKREVILESLQYLGIDPSKSHVSTHDGGFEPEKYSLTLKDHDNPFLETVRVSKDGPVKVKYIHNELLLSNDAVKQLINEGVSHPVLEAVANHLGYEKPRKPIGFAAHM